MLAAELIIFVTVPVLFRVVQHVQYASYPSLPPFYRGLASHTVQVVFQGVAVAGHQSGYWSICWEKPRIENGPSWVLYAIWIVQCTWSLTSNSYSVETCSPWRYHAAAQPAVPEFALQNRLCPVAAAIIQSYIQVIDHRHHSVLSLSRVRKSLGVKISRLYDSTNYEQGASLGSKPSPFSGDTPASSLLSLGCSSLASFSAYTPSDWMFFRLSPPFSSFYSSLSHLAELRPGSSLSGLYYLSSGSPMYDLRFL